MTDDSRPLVGCVTVGEKPSDCGLNAEDGEVSWRRGDHGGGARGCGSAHGHRQRRRAGDVEARTRLGECAVEIVWRTDPGDATRLRLGFVEPKANDLVSIPDM